MMACCNTIGNSTLHLGTGLAEMLLTMKLEREARQLLIDQLGQHWIFYKLSRLVSSDWDMEYDRQFTITNYRFLMICWIVC